MEPLRVETSVCRDGIYMDCVFGGTAYNADRERVRFFRLEGIECPKIAEKTGLPMEQVIDYCRELGLPETGNCHLVVPEKAPNRYCPVCGRVLAQCGKGYPKSYCSVECRKDYKKKQYKRRREEKPKNE